MDSLYGETGVMDFGLNRVTWHWFTCKWNSASRFTLLRCRYTQILHP